VSNARCFHRRCLVDRYALVKLVNRRANRGLHRRPSVRPHHYERIRYEICQVAEDGPAGKAGFKSGDVLTQYGGRRIDNPVDYDRLRHAYYEGEKVMVTVIRGDEKITKEVTLEEMR
jgi:hypothetical protein